MKAFLLLFILAGVLPSRADDTKIRQALEKGIVTGQFLQTLTPDDVPDKWKVQEETKEKDNTTTRTFRRGGVQVLSVFWPNNPKPEMQKFFVAVLYHGKKSLTTVARQGESVTVMPANVPKEYKVFTSIKDDGTVSVTVFNEEAAFFESVVVKGRDTHPIDDLDYTKTALAMEGITKPLIEALQNEMDKPPAKKSDE